MEGPSRSDPLMLDLATRFGKRWTQWQLPPRVIAAEAKANENEIMSSSERNQIACSNVRWSDLAGAVSLPGAFHSSAVEPMETAPDLPDTGTLLSRILRRD